jgi:hypothetical protein
MNRLRSLPPSAAVFALLLAGSLARAEEQPPVLPTRDVDITYDVTRPHQPKIRERVRWSASQHLQRIDGPDKSATIFDHAGHEITLLTPKNRSYRKLEGTPRQPPTPEAGAVLKRGNEAVIAGVHCVDWSWTVDVETHTVCMTPDGVLLRLVIDGQTVMQARSVSYGAQGADLFRIPRDYSPALAPEGTGL